MRVKLQEGKRTTETVRQGKKIEASFPFLKRQKMQINNCWLNKQTFFRENRHIAPIPLHSFKWILLLKCLMLKEQPSLLCTKSCLSSAYTMVTSANSLLPLSNHVTVFSLETRQ